MTRKFLVTPHQVCRGTESQRPTAAVPRQGRFSVRRIALSVARSAGSGVEMLPPFGLPLQPTVKERNDAS